MNKNDLKLLIASALKVGVIDEISEMGKTRGWDSIRQVQLMLTLEEKCGVAIPADAFGELTSFSEIALFLKSESVLTDE